MFRAKAPAPEGSGARVAGQVEVDEAVDGSDRGPRIDLESVNGSLRLRRAGSSGTTSQ